MSRCTARGDTAAGRKVARAAAAVHFSTRLSASPHHSPLHTTSSVAVVQQPLPFHRQQAQEAWAGQESGRHLCCPCERAGAPRWWPFAVLLTSGTPLSLSSLRVLRCSLAAAFLICRSPRRRCPLSLFSCERRPLSSHTAALSGSVVPLNSAPLRRPFHPPAHSRNAASLRLSHPQPAPPLHSLLYFSHTSAAALQPLPFCAASMARLSFSFC